MIEQSRICHLSINIIQFIWSYIQQSYFFQLYIKFAKWLGKAIDDSRIMSFFYSNWDKAVKTSQSQFSNLTYKKIMTLGAKYRVLSNPIKKAMDESFLLGLVDQKMIFVLLTILVFILPFAPTMVLAGLCVIIGSLYVAAILLGRLKLHKPTLVGIAFVAFGLCYVYGTFTSYQPMRAFQVTLILAVFMFLFFVLEECIQSMEQLNIFFNSLLLSAVIVSCYGIYQYLTGVEMDSAWVDKETFGELKRIYSTFGNPNVLGQYLVVVTSISVGMFWKEKNIVKKGIYFGILGVIALCLAMTMSRGAMLAFILALGFFVLLSEKRLIPFGIVALILLPFVLPDVLWQRLASSFDLNDSSSLYRISILKASGNMIQTYWPSGIGVDSFNLVYPIYSFEAGNAYHAHNTFLQILIELGIQGITVFCAFIGLFLQRLYAVKKKVSREHVILIGVIFGGFLGLLLQGMTDHIWFNYKITLLFWILMGSGMTVARLGEDAL